MSDFLLGPRRLLGPVQHENGPTMEVTLDDGTFRVRLVAGMRVSNGRVRDLRFDRNPGTR